MGKTKIEWVRADDGSAGYSWNALRAQRKQGGRPGVTANHCEHVNEACRWCYSERNNPRLGGLAFKPGHRNDYNFILDEDTLLNPIRKKKPARWFVESTSDLFGDWWPLEFVHKIYAVMALTPWHTYINLTKRPERRRQYLADPEMPRYVTKAGADLRQPDWFTRGTRELLEIGPLPNVIEGTSVSCQEEADEFVPILLATKAAVRVVSAEPLLGPIDFRHHFGMSKNHDDMRGLLHWLIVGGESGPNARPMNPEWARSIRDQCDAAGVAFHFKQWGEWAPKNTWNLGKKHAIFDGTAPAEILKPGWYPGHSLPQNFVERVGKEEAGRLLGGKEHNGFPQLRASK